MSIAEEYADRPVRVIASILAMMPRKPPQSSNYEKFQTSNPVVRALIGRFFARVRAIVEEVQPGSLLDAGCGEGETLAHLGGLLPPRVAAVDVSPEAAEHTADRFPFAEVAVESIYDLPFADDSFDLVLCLEVLEHLRDSRIAVAELARVASGTIVVSVPHEPFFRVGSLVRGKYVRTLGNHPEHINHWNPRSLRRLLEPDLEVVSLNRSFPWLVARCQVR
jgi:SAM-dependent methyltransferase